MRCLECGYASPNVIGRYCPGCGSDKFRNDADLANLNRFDLKAPTTYLSTEQ